MIKVGRHLIVVGIMYLCTLTMAARADNSNNEIRNSEVQSTVKPATSQGTVPGVVINHIPASTGIYIGSPSIIKLPGGTLIARHDEFGPGSTQTVWAVTRIFASKDNGATWSARAVLQGQFWSTLFLHQGSLYLIGTTREYGFVVIRRSDDDGVTWTDPTDPGHGLLLADGEYHCAPVPVIEYKGRIWRAMEKRDPPSEWGIHFCAGMLSAPVDADLLNTESWKASNFLPSSRAWNRGDMGAWLEGNAVVSPSGEMLDVLRVQTHSPDEKAAIVHISADGGNASFDPASDFIAFPGGAKKFTIRYDKRSQCYWTLASIVTPQHRRLEPGSIRNTLALLSSKDLKHWELQRTLLYVPEEKRHGFQYVDWQFDGADIIYACRTAFDDEEGGAHNYHDANYLTFHRIKQFRNHNAGF